ncbi:hypothetical protein VTH06DRAFT_8777 [Thermothelomyces fergusii]
MSITVY